MKKRLIYVAGVANDEDIDLYIQKDLENMKEIFEPLEDEGKIVLRTDEVLTTDLLSKRFTESRVLPWLFYFSGHSEEKYIELADKKVSKKNFTDLMSNQMVKQHLQLVYLSSCKSKAIGKALVKKGVKVVIVSNADVSAHLANMVSRYFFSHLMISNNILEAYEVARTRFFLKKGMLDISAGAVNDPPFPWEILSANETNLTDPLPKIQLNPEQKHRMLMLNVQIDLELNNYFQNYSKENKITLNKVALKKELVSMKDNLEASLDLVKGDNKIKALFKVWKSSSSNLNSKRFPKTNKRINELSNPAQFKINTANTLEGLIKSSDELLTNLL